MADNDNLGLHAAMQGDHIGRATLHPDPWHRELGRNLRKARLAKVWRSSPMAVNLGKRLGIELHRLLGVTTE